MCLICQGATPTLPKTNIQHLKHRPGLPIKLVLETINFQVQTHRSRLREDTQNHPKSELPNDVRGRAGGNVTFGRRRFPWMRDKTISLAGCFAGSCPSLGLMYSTWNTGAGRFSEKFLARHPDLNLFDSFLGVFSISFFFDRLDDWPRQVFGSTCFGSRARPGAPPAWTFFFFAPLTARLIRPWK